MSRKRKPIEQSEVELGRVITPFLDMAFQILFFFVMQYQPSALEGQLDMALPATGQGVAREKPDQSSPETDIELPAELEVIVRTRDLERQDQVQDGTIGRILVKDSAGERAVGNQEDLRKYLEKVRPTLNNQDDIKIQADGRLKYVFVVEVMDICRRAGFQNVGFAPPPDLQQILPGVP